METNVEHCHMMECCYNSIDLTCTRESISINNYGECSDCNNKEGFETGYNEVHLKAIEEAESAQS